jgi:uncharacterized membrane protein YbhN (UPF0104 family)
LAVAVGVSAALLWLIATQVDVHRVSAVLGAADARLIAAAVVAALFVNLPLSALSLERALAAHGVKLSLGAALGATVGHLALHAGGTAVVGKAARALYLSKAHGVEAAAAVRAEVTLLALKLVALLVLAAAGAALARAWWSAPCLVLVLGALVAWGERRGARAAALSGAFAWALAMGMGQLVVFTLALRSLDVTLPVIQVLGLFPLCLVGAKLPVSLMGLGVREALVLLMFRGSVPAEALLGATLLFSLTEQVLPGLLGLGFSPRFVARTLRG